MVVQTVRSALLSMCIRRIVRCRIVFFTTPMVNCSSCRSRAHCHCARNSAYWISHPARSLLCRAVYALPWICKRTVRVVMSAKTTVSSCVCRIWARLVRMVWLIRETFSRRLLPTKTAKVNSSYWPNLPANSGRLRSIIHRWMSLHGMATTHPTNTIWQRSMQ